MRACARSSQFWPIHHDSVKRTITLEVFPKRTAVANGVFFYLVIRFPPATVGLHMAYRLLRLYLPLGTVRHAYLNLGGCLHLH